jgi:hypothetical protein
MSAIPFAAHAFIKRLTGAGMPEVGAEIMADEQARLIESQLATKMDLELLKNELTVRVGGMLLTLGGVLIAVKFMSH